jgi:hypothetical protein
VLLGYEIIHDTSVVLFLQCTFDWVVVYQIQQIYNQSISISRVFLSDPALARSKGSLPGPLPDFSTQGKPKGEVIQCTYVFLLSQPKGADVIYQSYFLTIHYTTSRQDSNSRPRISTGSYDARRQRTTRGYDHNFLRFLPIFGKEIGVFLKNQCYDKNFA